MYKRNTLIVTESVELKMHHQKLHQQEAEKSSGGENQLPDKIKGDNFRMNLPTQRFSLIKESVIDAELTGLIYDQN